MRIQINGRLRKYSVHILVAKAFIGECPPGWEHNHKDGNKRNARPDNLEFVTKSENIRHAYRVLGKTTQQGSKHGMHKLTETEVVQIRTLHAQGLFTLQQLASNYGVSVPSISMIVTR